MREDIGVVTAVMHDTTDLDGAVSFWTDILGLDVVHRDDTYVYLSKMTPDGPHLAFQLVAEPRAGKNRIHLDVRVPDRAEFEARVVALGGSTIEAVAVEGYPQWTVMADPQGNEFCIYSSDG